MVSKYQSEKEREFPERGTCISLYIDVVRLLVTLKKGVSSPIIFNFMEWFLGMEPTTSLDETQNAILGLLKQAQLNRVERYREKCERYRANALKRSEKQKAAMAK